MGETSFVIVRPSNGVIVSNSEGVDSVKGLEVMEVR